MERATFTSQLIKDGEDYKKIEEEIQKQIENYGTRWLSLAPAVDDFQVLQGVCGSTSIGAECEALYEALKGTKTKDEIVFLIKPSNVLGYELRKFPNGEILYREIYPDNE